jgi:pilus assembly protein CpaE
LIGSDPEITTQLRRELFNRTMRIDAEFSEAAEAALALRKFSSEKRVLIAHLASIHDPEPLGLLTAHFPGWPVLVLVDGYDPKAITADVVVEIMRAGASQILSMPILGDDLKAALDRIAVQYVYSVRDTKVIAVAGATGGSGATSIALNLAYEIADRHNIRCVLVDLSLRMGVVASHLNLEPTHTIIDLIRNINRVDAYLVQKALIRVADNFEILAGPQTLLPPMADCARAVVRLVDTLKQIADVIVLDVPCTYDDIYFETLATASRTVLIGEQKLPSIRALKMVREAIARNSGTEHLVINQYDPKIKGFTIDRLLKPLGVTNLQTISRDDPGMSVAMEAAKTLRLASPRSTALADIVALADDVMALAPAVRKKPKGLFSRLGRALVNS